MFCVGSSELNSAPLAKAIVVFTQTALIDTVHIGNYNWFFGDALLNDSFVNELKLPTNMTTIDVKKKINKRNKTGNITLLISFIN